MSGAATNSDIDSAGGVVAPKLPGGATLPFPPTPSGSIAGRTLQESTYAPQPTPPRLHEDSPNIVIVLIDDAGPGLPTTFGGEVRTPTMDRICAQGVSYNRFHTTAMCSPTRASLLTGRNHHEIGNGQIAELANDWDGYAGRIPRSSALVAEVLKDYGYSTGAWGKWHNTPAEETTAAGPFEDWPTGLGFEYFYGFLTGRHPSTNRIWCAIQRWWRRQRPSKRAITSRRILPMMPSPGCAPRRRCGPISRYSCIGRAAACTARTMS